MAAINIALSSVSKKIKERKIKNFSANPNTSVVQKRISNKQQKLARTNLRTKELVPGVREIVTYFLGQDTTLGLRLVHESKSTLSMKKYRFKLHTFSYKQNAHLYSL